MIKLIAVLSIFLNGERIKIGTFEDKFECNKKLKTVIQEYRPICESDLIWVEESKKIKKSKKIQ